MERVNIAKTDYDPKISRIPELIGKRRLLLFLFCLPVTLCKRSVQ